MRPTTTITTLAVAALISSTVFAQDAGANTTAEIKAAVAATQIKDEYSAELGTASALSLREQISELLKQELDDESLRQQIYELVTKDARPHDDGYKASTANQGSIKSQLERLRKANAKVNERARDKENADIGTGQ